MTEYNNKRIDFKDKNTEGVEVPDGLITINHTNLYKLLEALNLDWKNIDIPWAKSIERWNSAFNGARDGDGNIINTSPFNDDGTNKLAADYLNELSYNWNNLSNSIDWLRRNYDYLTDNGYTFGDDPDNQYVGIPNWAEDGKIHGSEDIADILNYLIWRIVNIDYFTAHWDSRNALETFLRYVIGWTDDNRINSIGKDDTALFFDAESQRYYITDWTTSTVTLLPSFNSDRRPISILYNTNVFRWYHDEKGLTYNEISNLLFPMIISNSPGNVILNTSSMFPPKTIEIAGNSFPNVGSYGDSPDIKYLFKADIQVIGTGRYNEPYLRATDSESGWFANFVNNGRLDQFDPMTNTVEFEIMQKGTNDINTGSEYSDSKPQTVSININKTANAILTLSLFNINVINKSGVPDETNGYGKYYNQFSENDAISLPFFGKTTTETDYPINFNLSYGEEYGIKPYFALQMNDRSERSEINVDTSGNFESCHGDHVGSIRKINNRFYYIPPVQDTSDDTDKIVKVYYAFYYNDTEASRQVTPVCGFFYIRLTARIYNRIIFLPNHTTTYDIYQYVERNLEFSPVRIQGQNKDLAVVGDIVLNNGILPKTASDSNNNCFNNETGGKISYAIRTINFEDALSADGKSESLRFDNFVTTYCSSQTSVEYLGYINSSADIDRTINLIEENLDSSYVLPNRNNTNVQYPIKLNSIIKVGENEDGSFYFANGDTPYNYKVSEGILNKLDKTTNADDEEVDVQVITDDQITTDFFNYTEDDIESKEYIEKERDGRYNYKLLKSTAVYPSNNGIFIPDGESDFVDADNDYYYLVFRISSNEGTIGNISFSACVGYYFLRILRIENNPPLTFIGDTTSEIIYSGADSRNYSFRLMTRTPIYLNRLFTESSQRLLSTMTGKFYWQFYGENSTGEAFQLDPKIVALQSPTEKFIKLYNEGDKIDIEYIKDTTPNAFNVNTKYKPEYNTEANSEAGYLAINGVNNININNTNGSKTVGKYNSLVSGRPQSGAVLWVNKLMHATSDADDTTYENIINDYVSLLLNLSIGNSDKYLRFTNSSIFSLTIHKRPYDIEFQHVKLTNGRYTDFFLNEGKTMAQPWVIYFNVNNANNSTYRPTNIAPGLLTFTSNEYGAGVENATAELSDRVPIFVDSSTGLSKLDLSAEIQPVVIISSPAINDDWCTTDLYTVPENYSNNLILVYYTDNNSTSGTPAAYRTLYLYPRVRSNNQTPDALQITIEMDKYGIYKRKEMNLYISIKDPDVEVQTGD